MTIDNRQSAIRNRNWPSRIGWLATAIAVTGVVLNNQQIIACFGFWIVSNALTAGLHVRARMWALATRDVVFLILAIWGLIAWSSP